MSTGSYCVLKLVQSARLRMAHHLACTSLQCFESCMKTLMTAHQSGFVSCLFFAPCRGYQGAAQPARFLHNGPSCAGCGVQPLRGGGAPRAAAPSGPLRRAGPARTRAGARRVRQAGRACSRKGRRISHSLGGRTGGGRGGQEPSDGHGSTTRGCSRRRCHAQQ